MTALLTHRLPAKADVRFDYPDRSTDRGENGEAEDEGTEPTHHHTGSSTADQRSLRGA
jgi:hypothetical protein